MPSMNKVRGRKFRFITAVGIGEIGKLVRGQRQILGWSQEELSKACDAGGQFTVSKIETGRVPRLQTLDRVARALGCRLMVSFVPNGKKKR